MRPNRVLLVGNPTAQSGKNAERIERARAVFASLKLAHDFRPTLPHGKTVDDVAGQLRTGAYDTVAYMGGDGTFAEVAKAILSSGRAAQVRLGMLPTGTANDQGKSFGLTSAPEELERNVGVIAHGHETKLDAGRVQALDELGMLVKEDWFFDSAGWGISPRVLALRNEDRRAIEDIPLLREVYRDQLVYAGAMLRTFLESYVEDDKFDVEVTADGHKLVWTGLSDMIVKGTRVYGGLWVLDPNARHDDGRFEVAPFAGRRDWVSKAMVHLDESGTVDEALQEIGVGHSKGVSASSIVFAFRRSEGALPLAAQIDGEEFPATPHVRIDVEQGVLRLIVPETEASRA